MLLSRFRNSTLWQECVLPLFFRFHVYPWTDTHGVTGFVAARSLALWRHGLDQSVQKSFSVATCVQGLGIVTRWILENLGMQVDYYSRSNNRFASIRSGMKLNKKATADRIEFKEKRGGEPDPRHSQWIAVAASFRTWPSSLLCNAGRPAFNLRWTVSSRCESIPVHDG